MKKLFINYRSEDTGQTASRLLQDLEREFTPDQIFLDHARIEAGSEWPERLKQEILSASALLCLIGKSWLQAHDPETGDRLLTLPDDWVRQEIETAIKVGIPIIPILVDNATGPTSRAFQTVPSLALIATLQCLQLRREDWSNDFNTLAHWLSRHGLTKRTTDHAPSGGTTRSGPKYVREIGLYRKRLSGLFDRWDLSSVGVASSGPGARPLEVQLDEIYLPLRVAEGYNAEVVDHGAVYSPWALLARDRPLVVRGVAGSGKTTWVRWTFRRLLADQGAFPMVVELRRLGGSWGKPATPNEQRTIGGYLRLLLGEYAGPEWESILDECLDDPDGPRPVLFIDGWDELGPLGEEVRFKLIRFQQDHPRVRIVVTSRPYGEGRPSYAEGFDVLDIQPLSPEEIELFTSRFYDRCWGEDQRAGDDYKKRFLTSLKRSPDAASLARTALLLTMMLFISRVRQLPDKRHLLYQNCVEHLLTALPERKREEGVLIVAHQWRPSDSEETLRVTALLAFRMQTGKYLSRNPIVVSFDDMKKLLPDLWRDDQRTKFLNWLRGPAGLLVDRSDESLSFAHLSFQEYLTAWHLYASIEGAEDRVKTFNGRLEERTWWETLRIWAALVVRSATSKSSACC